MPQMSPMWWEILFILFNLLFMLINIMLFWNMETKKSSIKLITLKSKNIWKW